MSATNPGFIRRTWRALRRPSVKWSVLTLLLIGFFGGIIFWGGFNTGMEATNRLEFCISCHEMRDNVYQEYKKTIHYSQPHRRARDLFRLPRAARLDPQDASARSRRAAKLWGKLTGYVDTKEKFEAHRMETGDSTSGRA